MIPYGSKQAPLEQQNAFHEAMKRLWQTRCHYSADAKDFLRALHQTHPEPVRPTYRAPLRGVVRRS